jgi:hypothetical protein
MSTDAKLLCIYLQDHFAGATAGAARARRFAEAESASTDGGEIATFADEVEQDRQSLLAAMGALGVAPNGIKNGLASLGEKLGSFKPNGYVVQRSPLTSVIEIEAMQMAVRGKRSLWQTLTITSRAEIGDSIDLDDLTTRAGAQLELLDRLHQHRVTAALSH